MKEHHIIVNKTARFYTFGELSENTRQVWFVLHGFGYSAARFLKYFEPLLRSDTFFIAPEGLNRFYLKGPGGDVGATWMTKEDRLNEIKDYVHYLDDLYEQFDLEQHPQLKITALGFSQGASTVTRWVNATAHRVDNMVAYAGEVAPEVVPLHESSGLKKSNNYFIYGDTDEFFPPDAFQLIIQRSAELNMVTMPFNGGHVIKPETLKFFWE